MAGGEHRIEPRRDRQGVVRHWGEWLSLWSDPEALSTSEERGRLAAARARHAAEGGRLAAAARALAEAPRFIPPRDTDAAGDDDGERLAARRGRADSAALRERFHDAALHASLRPQEGPAGRLFDIAERVRFEALGAQRLPGVAANLAAAQVERITRADLLNAHIAALVPLTEALEMVLRDRFLGAREETVPVSGFWMWNRWLTTRLAPEFDTMGASLADQGAYAAATLAMLERLFELLESRNAGERFAPDRGGDARGGRAEDGTLADEAEAAGHVLPSQAEEAGFEPGADVLADLGAGEETDLARAVRSAAPPPPYRVFTTAFDAVVDAATFVEGEELRELRQELEEKHGDVRREVARLAGRLTRKLLAQQRRAWVFDREEGLLDAARLHRVIVNPGIPLAFKEESESHFRDTVVTLLVDNSGSMRGRPIEIAAIVADMAAAALERCGVAVEVLGYTTSAWKGGAAARRWAAEGRPADPGRLNDLLHVVFKAADTPYRRARPALAAMLRPDHLKENIDGEALIWAASRLAGRRESRKVLIVISDGAPADQATMENNADRQILERHLREVIAAIEKGGAIELSAIGVKHDVSTYYRNAVVVPKADALVPAVFAALDGVFAG